MSNNNMKWAVGALTALAAGAAAVYLSDSKNRKAVTKSATKVQKKGAQLFSQISEKAGTQQLADKGMKKAVASAKSLKRKAAKKIKAVRRSQPLNHRVIHS